MIIQTMKTAFQMMKSKKGMINMIVVMILAVIALVVILYLTMNWADIADKFSGRLDNVGGHTYD